MLPPTPGPFLLWRLNMSHGRTESFTFHSTWWLWQQNSLYLFHGQSQCIGRKMISPTSGGNNCCPILLFVIFDRNIFREPSGQHTESYDCGSQKPRLTVNCSDHWACFCCLLLHLSRSWSQRSERHFWATAHSCLSYGLTGWTRKRA